MVIAVLIAGWLGSWQYDAWDQRRAAEAHDLSQAPVVELATIMDGDSPFPGKEIGRPVGFSGEWLGDTTFYISHRMVEDVSGYWVVTPVLVDMVGPNGYRSAMPVVRGWSPEPTSAPVSGPVKVEGWLQPTEAGGPPDDDPTDNILPMLRVAALVEHVDDDLYSGFVVARSVDDASMEGLEAVTPAAIPVVSGFTAARNLLYAIEWWIFGGFAFFIWFKWCRDTIVEQRQASFAAAMAELEEATISGGPQ